jgi:hypothetical protein
MEELERNLPIISLVEGADFYVDAFNGQLIDTKDKSNIIYEFDMLFLEDHFEMLFDKSARKVKETGWEWTFGNPRYPYIWLRRLEVYDPEGAKKSATEEQLLKFKSLPIVEIEGIKFLWDRQQALLRRQDNPWNAVYKNDMGFRSGTEGFYYDTQRNLVPFPHELSLAKEELPEHIKFVPKSVLLEKIQRAEHAKCCKVIPPVEAKKLKRGR